MKTSEPDAYPVAYCAPGKRFDAALTLTFKGERVARITEHPWLEGITDVIVVGEPPELLFDREAYRPLLLSPVPPWTPITGI